MGKELFLSGTRRKTIILVVAVLSFTAFSAIPVHALNEIYSLTPSPSRLQESNTARVLLILNVSNASTASYAFTWNVRDPNGALHTSSNNQTGVPHPASFVLSSAYPTRFNGSPTLAYVGIYSVWVNQTMPPVVGSTGVAISQFRVGITNATGYPRLSTVSVQAVGYAANAIVTIRISGSTGTVSGFPLNKTADGTGALSYTWVPPAMLAVGDYTLTLSAASPKPVQDVQTFTITPTNVTISPIIISKTLLQTSQTEDFRFTATYSNLSPVRSGSVNLRLLEADLITTHYIPMSYSTTLGAFHGSFQVPLSADMGSWIATVDANSFDDGYGNKGPSLSVFKPFTVAPATLTVSASTNYGNYTVGANVVVYASVVTPGGYNFTSGTVTATTYHGSSQIGGPLQLFYDQSRGKWVGSYIVNSTDPSGIWQIHVNATDVYGNTGQGSTTTLVNVPTAPSQAPTFNYLLVLTVAAIVGLAVLASWIAFGRRRTMRKVLKVDLEAVHAEAKKVENQEFFKKVQEQLSHEKEGRTGSQS